MPAAPTNDSLGLLAQVSERLRASDRSDPLEVLLDAVIAFSGADGAFLALAERGRVEVKASRGVVYPRVGDAVPALRPETPLSQRECALRRIEAVWGASAAMEEVVHRLHQIAPIDVPVLILGEAGTGRTFAARQLHAKSGRPGPFESLYVSALPEALLDEALDEKFRSARRGTLYLGEIEQLPPRLQAKVAHALRARRGALPGGAAQEPIDFRLIASASASLAPAVAEGCFREDLSHALEGVTIALPPLRARGDDLLALAHQLLRCYVEEFGSRARDFSPAAVAAMRLHTWPGNLRELARRIQRAAATTESDLVEPEALDLRAGALAAILPLAQAREAFQQEYIHRALEVHGGNRTRTAKALGVDPRTIFRYLEKQGAEPSPPPATPGVPPEEKSS